MQGTKPIRGGKGGFRPKQKFASRPMDQQKEYKSITDAGKIKDNSEGPKIVNESTIPIFDSKSVSGASSFTMAQIGNESYPSLTKKVDSSITNSENSLKTKCTFCNETSHNSHYCPILLNAKADDNSNDVQPPKTCHYCKQPGHFRNNCPKLHRKQKYGENIYPIRSTNPFTHRHTSHLTHDGYVQPYSHKKGPDFHFSLNSNGSDGLIRPLIHVPPAISSSAMKSVVQLRSHLAPSVSSSEQLVSPSLSDLKIDSDSENDEENEKLTSINNVPVIVDGKENTKEGLLTLQNNYVNSIELQKMNDHQLFSAAIESQDYNKQGNNQQGSSSEHHDDSVSSIEKGVSMKQNINVDQTSSTKEAEDFSSSNQNNQIENAKASEEKESHVNKKVTDDVLSSVDNVGTQQEKASRDGTDHKSEPKGECIDVDNDNDYLDIEGTVEFDTSSSEDEYDGDIEEEPRRSEPVEEDDDEQYGLDGAMLIEDEESVVKETNKEQE